MARRQTSSWATCSPTVSAARPGSTRRAEHAHARRAGRPSLRGMASRSRRSRAGLDFETEAAMVLAAGASARAAGGARPFGKEVRRPARGRLHGAGLGLRRGNLPLRKAGPRHSSTIRRTRRVMRRSSWRSIAVPVLRSQGDLLAALERRAGREDRGMMAGDAELRRTVTPTGWRHSRTRWRAVSQPSSASRFGGRGAPGRDRRVATRDRAGGAEARRCRRSSSSSCNANSRN